MALDFGMSVRQASAATGVPRSTVQHWRQSGFRLCRQQGSGRPRKTSCRTDRHLCRLAASDPTLSLTEIGTVSGAPVSKETVRQRLKAAGFVSRKKPAVLVLSEAHKQRRQQWAMAHCLWRTPSWKRVVWSDEASVRLRSRDGRLRLWIRPTHHLPEEFATHLCQAGGGWLLVWGAIWIGGRSQLHVTTQTMNAERYVEVLENYVSPIAFELGDPCTDWLFMDDNAPPHRSHLATAFKAAAGIRTLPWPARSPDLNPIENVWSLLKLDVRKRLRPDDGLDRLQELLQQSWQGLSQAVIDHLVESMPSRVSEVIENHGGCTGY